MAKLAYLGLGTMGIGMASNLLAAGHELKVWDRTPEKAGELFQDGAVWADTPALASRGVEAIFYSLANDEAVEAVVFGKDGILSAIEPGQIAIDMSTVAPETSRKEFAAFQEKQALFMDCPVFGSKPEAAKGGLWIMAGGDQRTFERVKPWLKPLAETIHHFEGIGKAAIAKLCGNLIVSAQIEAIGESFILATKAGLDLNLMLDVFSKTDFASGILNGMGRKVIERDFEPAFKLTHMLKDIRLIASLADSLDVPVPGLQVVLKSAADAVDQGFGDENASALIKALETEAQVKIGMRDLKAA